MHNVGENSVWGFQIVLPNANDAPTKLAQFAVHAAVTGLIRDKLLFPERTVASGNFAMLGAAVPETAVHKYRELEFLKNEVRLAEDFLIPPPAGDTGGF